MFSHYKHLTLLRRFPLKTLGSYNTKKVFMSTLSKENKKELLALPATAEETVNVGINDTYKLKELGPVVVNEDGTISRINNWHEMADIEKSNVNRILLKRNRERLALLKEKIKSQ